MIYEFEVEGKIIGKERPRINMNSGHVYTPNRTKDYEALIQQAFFIKYRKQLNITNRVFVSIVAYFKIPTSTRKVDKELMLKDLISPTKKPDADNLAKAFIDQMTKLKFWKDDSHISSIKSEKRYNSISGVYVRGYEL